MKHSLSTLILLKKSIIFISKLTLPFSSISIVDAANSSTMKMVLPSKAHIPSMTGAAQPRTGELFTLTILAPVCPRKRPS